MNEDRLRDIETPQVLVDQARLLRNIRWAARLASEHRLALRPHIKTHKCVEIARIQLAEGAAGITASKTEEALTFVSAGFPSVTVAYPVIDPRKIDLLLQSATEHSTELRMVLDSEAGLNALLTIAEPLRTTVGVYVEVDVGLRRCGLREADPRLLELVQRIHASRRLRFVGIFSHAGHAYGAKGKDEVRRIAQDEAAIMGRVRASLEGAGYPVGEVSVGSTPTLLAAESFGGITEIRPGNYVFMDQAPVRLGLVSYERVALTVLATVVSANDDYLIMDAGSKVLSSDLGAHGASTGSGYGVAFSTGDYETMSHPMPVVKLSEEHGFLQRGASPLAIGSQVRIIPNHACPVANLAQAYCVLQPGPEIVIWPVAARGQVH